MTRKKGPKIDSSQIEEMNKEVGELLARCFDEVGEAPLRELNAFLDRAPPDKYLRHRAFVANECGEPSKALDYLRRWPQHARQESPTPFDCEEFHNAIELFLDNPPRGIWSALAEAFAIAWPDSAATHC